MKKLNFFTPMDEFIQENGEALDLFINKQNGIGSCSVCGKDRITEISDRERELWVRNTPYLYQWAKESGVDFS